MKRPTVLAILGLLLLLATALLLRREPREEKPARPPKPPPVAEVSPPEPEAPPPAAAQPPKPPPASPPKTKPPSREPRQPARAAVDRSQLGVVRGRVKIRGKRPPRSPLRMVGDPQCQALHQGVVLNDDLVVDPEGGVRWAFVYVKSGLKAEPPPVSQDPVLLDQIGCVFTPHVLGVRVGQPLMLANSDPLLHNVHMVSFNNLVLNVGLTKGMEHIHRFTQQEVMVPVRCNVHPWMAAWVGALDHPYFGVTEATGAFSIPNLPLGRYVFEVWHEKYASVSREYDVVVDDEVQLDFVLDARKQ